MGAAPAASAGSTSADADAEAGGPSDRGEDAQVLPRPALPTLPRTGPFLVPVMLSSSLSSSRRRRPERCVGPPSPASRDAHPPRAPCRQIPASQLEKFMSLVETTKSGYSVNDHIRNAKSFRNPDILEKLGASAASEPTTPLAASLALHLACPPIPRRCPLRPVAFFDVRECGTN